MLRTGIAFLLGHCFIHGLGALPPWRPWLVLPCALAILLLARRWTMPAALLLGMAWAWGHAALRLSQDMPVSLEGEDVVVHGRIASLPERTASEQRFELDVVHAGPGVPSHIGLAWYDSIARPNAARPNAGELWQFVVRLQRRNGFANPGGFDYEGYLFRAGIGATGYVRDDERNRRLDAASPRYAILCMRAWIAQRVSEAVGPSVSLGILQGLAVGDTHAVSTAQWRVFAATGTSHLMAISGLHIGMIAAFGAWAGGMLWRCKRRTQGRMSAIEARVLGGASTALAYSLLAGLSVPTQRTLLMLAIYFGARWWRRELSVGHALGAALIGVLLLDPFAPLAMGAWLSFGAVSVILLAVAGRLGRDGAIRQFARVQWAVTLGLLPLLMIGFGGVSLIAPVANAVAVPLFTLVLVPLTLLGALAACIWLPAGGAVLGLGAGVLDACWPAFEWLSRQPLAVWYFPSLPPSVYALLAAGLLLLVAPGIWPLRVVAVLLCLPALTFRPAAPVAGEFRLTLLDVGQGLAAVVQTRSHVLVYDAGPAFRSGRDSGDLVIVPYLRSVGVRRLDTLMISHGDLDHRGGMHSILRALPVVTLQTGPSVTKFAQGVHPCRRGQRWVWDQVEFEVLHPGAQVPVRDNDSSCVLRVAGKGGSALLTGDIQREAEAELLAASPGRADVVIVPHHGSNTSSTDEFIAAMQPRLALCSAGYRNRWGFPKPAVVERWRSAGARVLTTADSGAIEVAMPASGVIEAREYRREQRRYWRRNGS